jgi:hypothetical protein
MFIKSIVYYETWKSGKLYQIICFETLVLIFLFYEMAWRVTRGYSDQYLMKASVDDTGRGWWLAFTIAGLLLSNLINWLCNIFNFALLEDLQYAKYLPFCYTQNMCLTIYNVSDMVVTFRLFFVCLALI